ncbi:MAG TPA: D-alanyl-D-alanine carboxypeptidase/D-alanyl-D-alanine-endopeptidase [Mycobacteriales bacterium]|nr:D-alanyl-D-alanine carboxypeptidase/D-alanyl-D-alanine-endopeptidase [Mycobacteriales bacterium]
MRWSRVAPLAAASVVTVAVGAVVAVRYESKHPSAAPTAAASAAPTRAPVLSAVASSAAPARSTVTAAVRPALARFPTGEQLAGEVVDVSSGATLWSMSPRAEMAPASTTKLLTAAAALQTLGADFRFTTSTRRAGDTVYLVGGGDPTLVRTDTSTAIPAYPRPASLADLAEQTAAGLTPGTPVRLRVDTSAWSGPPAARGWQPNYVTEGDVTPPSALELDGGRLHTADFDSERTPTPAAQATQAFADLLRADGVEVNGPIEAATAPPTARPLASVSSPPLAELVQRMLTDSDNDLAEALGRAVAAAQGLPADFSGAAQAVTGDVARYGVSAADVTLYDTSGLSHDDRLDPVALVDVLRAAASPTEPALRPIVEGLPVAGFTGTLADRYRGKTTAAGAGVVRAKTGTLTGVDTLAGLVTDASGNLLAFALMASGPDAETDVEAGLDRIASTLET